jgi:hypothetical protein
MHGHGVSARHTFCANVFSVVGAVVAIVGLLEVAAAASAASVSRSLDCVALSEPRTGKVWERAKQSSLSAYCDLLGAASSRLSGPTPRVEEIPRLCDEAERLLPGQAAPLVLKARALLALGNVEDALRVLEEAKRRDARALEAPSAMLTWARVNARAGNAMEASSAFRAVLPRASAFSRVERGVASFEAAMALMALGAQSLDEVIVLLRRACADADDDVRTVARVALALSLDRAGLHAEARALGTELGPTNVHDIMHNATIWRALANAGALRERDALVAMALDATQPMEARAAWQRYLEGAGFSGPWAEHARTKLPKSPPTGRRAPVRGGVGP